MVHLNLIADRGPIFRWNNRVVPVETAHKKDYCEEDLEYLVVEMAMQAVIHYDHQVGPGRATRIARLLSKNRCVDNNVVDNVNDAAVFY